MRGLPVSQDADPLDAVRAWLAEGRTKSSGLLATKGVVLIEPREHRGRIIWPLVFDAGWALRAYNAIYVMKPCALAQRDAQEAFAVLGPSLNESFSVSSS